VKFIKINLLPTRMSRSLHGATAQLQDWAMALCAMARPKNSRWRGL
jgi:hypothetical protein